MLSFPLFSQDASTTISPIQQEFDSLKAALGNESVDTTRIQILLKMELLSTRLANSGVTYAAAAFELATTIGDSSLMANALYGMLDNEANQSDPDKLAIVESYLPFLERQPDNTFYLKVLIKIGNANIHAYNHKKVSIFLAKIEKAIAYNLSDSLIYVEYLDTKAYWMTRAVADKKNPNSLQAQTEDLFREALAVTKRHGGKREIFLAKYSLAYGLPFEEKNKAEAIRLLKECIAGAIEEGEKNDLAYFYTSLARWEEEVNPIDLALSLNYYNKALALEKASKVDWKIAMTLHRLANVYFKQNKLIKAKENLFEILSALDKSSLAALKVTYLTHSLLAKIYEKERNFELALKTEKLAHQLQDSMQAEGFNQQLAIEQNSFETKKQEQQNEILIYKNNLLEAKSSYARKAFFVMVLLFVVLTFFIFAMRLKNKEIQLQASRLKVLDKQKSQFFMNVAHELRTPLTLILGPLSNLIKERTDDKNLHADLQLIQRNSLQLEYLVEEVLDFSEVENRKLTIQEERTQLVPFIENIIKDFQQYAKWQEIDLMARCQIEKRLAVDLDRIKFKKVINNLCSNALKFTPKGGLIGLLLKEEEGNLLIQVSDTGKGILSEDIPKIFDRYYQTTDAELGGTGIGLALAKENVELMGGNISVTSKVGFGSTFRVILPIKNQVIIQEDLARLSEEQFISNNILINPKNSPTSKNSVPRILIVEDNPELIQYLQNIISPIYEVITAPNGLVAWELLTNTSPQPEIDLILTDVMMPQMDGFTLIEKLKNIPYWAKTPIIILTARADKANQTRALLAGVDDYIKKPFIAEELITRINKLLDFQEQKIIRASDEKEKVIAKVDVEWMKKVEQVVATNLTDAQFSVVFVAEKMRVSDRQLQRKINQLTGMSPQQYIKEIRLQKALCLLEDGIYSSVSEVSYEVGINTPKYFTRIFKERFGKLPSTLLD